jgi:hypothetical protein
MWEAVLGRFGKWLRAPKVMVGGTIVASSAPGLRSESVGAVADLGIEDEIDALEMDIDNERRRAGYARSLARASGCFQWHWQGQGVESYIELKDDADALSIEHADA